MASLIFAHAKSMVKNCRKRAADAASLDEKLGKNYTERYHYWYDEFIARDSREFDEYLRIAKMLHGQYLTAIPPSKQAYFITIRPDCNKVAFVDFFEKVQSFVNRECFIECTYSFEQKGTLPSELGTGFHVHIVTTSKHRSKGECLRDTLSSWKNWIDDGKIVSNCIDVGVTKNPEALVQNYLIEYKSDDNHKEPTKAMDELWRLENNLMALYKK